jgi:membrane associated rhomboid family serine protease
MVYTPALAPATPPRLAYFGGGGSPYSGSAVRVDERSVPAHMALNEQELYLHLDDENLSADGAMNPSSRGGGEGGSYFSDWSLARTLQAMEFEIDAETMQERRRYEQEEEQDRDFNRKEYGASACRKQMLTFSTLICVAQICILITMCSWDGMAPYSQNPMYGPPATTLVRFGAKDASLILYKKQWWRLFSPIMLHAGVIHLLSNVLIQLRVGGYLNLVFGNVRWMWIYLVSGVFGNICSCAFLPNSVGVGSSGALLGMLSAWIVWIVFRWKKIPEQCRSQRNCQLGMVVISVAVTLGMSFSPFVDWGAHFGGAIMGLLWGSILLSGELDNKFHAKILSITCLVITIALWIGGLSYMCVDMRPSRANWAVYTQNDDWHHHQQPQTGKRRG